MNPRKRRWQNLHDRFLEQWLNKTLAEALPTAREELEAAREAFGSEHPLVIRALLDLAMACQAGQKPDEAAQAEGQAQDLSRRLEARAVLQPEDPETADWLIFEADRWGNILGDDEAQVLAKYRRALAIRENHFGPDHPETADVIARLAEIDFLRGDFAEAEKQYRRALSRYEKSGDLERLYFVKTLEGLARTLQALGKHAEATAVFARSLALADQQGRDKRALYFLLVHYADSLDHLKQTPQGKQLRQRAQKLLPQTNPGAFGYDQRS